ncbi:hypothetical protein ARSEF4850_009811 [Beauveria asiatica]
MDVTYDSKALSLPAEVAATGGSISNFHHKQTVFHDEIRCDDANTFQHAAREAGNIDEVPATWTYKCVGKCSRSATNCVEELRAQIAHLRATADDVVMKRETGTGLVNKGSGILFPGKQQSAGCSRSPAWDGIEESSSWFSGTVSGVPAPNFSNLFDVPTKGFVLIDSWERILVSKLDGTISHAATNVAWRLTGVEVQCTDNDDETKPWAEQTSLQNGQKGRFRYECQLPQLGTKQDVLAQQLFAIGALRNARVLSAVMCCVELYHTAAKLLEMRDRTMATGLETRVGSLRTVNGVSFPKIPIKGDCLPPKLSGYATCPNADFERLCDREAAAGAMRNTSVMAMSLAYDRGVYGGSIAGMWAIMDSGFMYDYSTGNFSQKLGKRIGDAFITVRDVDTGNAALNAHLLDIVTVISCNFTAIKAKAALEDERKIKSQPCIAVWDDLAAVARYRMADAAFGHVWYDSPNDQRSLVLGGLGCALHDLIDIGPDVACAEVSNIIPSLTGGDLSVEALRSVYIGLVATLEWCAENDPFNPTGLAILFTHWWQLCNLRHRPVALMSRIEPSPKYAVCPDKLTSEPTFNCITRHNGMAFIEGQAVIDEQRRELARIEASLEAAGVTDLDGVISKLVHPVLDYTDNQDTCLPVEVTYCTEVLEAAISRRHSEKIKALWKLLLVMWKCGAIWMAVIANTQYAHQGLTNCDRGRDDYNASTWGKAGVPAEAEEKEEKGDTSAAEHNESVQSETTRAHWSMSKWHRLVERLLPADSKAVVARGISGR